MSARSDFGGFARAALVLVAMAACGAPRFRPATIVGGGAAGGGAGGGGASDAAITVERLDLEWSAVYLLRRGDAAILIDSGSPDDRDDLAAALAARGLDGRIGAVVITHAHADHAGNARWLQAHGAKIVLGAADAAGAARGHNEQLHATGLIAAWLAPTFMFPFEPFTADVAIDPAGGRGIDLGAFGLPEVRVAPAPGHTPGAIVAIVGDQVFAGDLVKGGRFTVLFTHTPSEHYYQGDRAADHRAIAALLDGGAARLWLGHGGPVDAADVRAWLAGADARAAPHAASIELDARAEVPRDGARGGAIATTIGLRARLGWGRAAAGAGWWGGVDARAGDVGGAAATADLHALGVALRDGRGGLVAITGGVGVDDARATGATGATGAAGAGGATPGARDAGAMLRAPLELSGELPVAGARLFARAGLAFRLAGAHARDALAGSAEAGATIGLRLGGDVAWGEVIAGRGPYLALSWRDLGGASLWGIAVGVDAFAGD